jgi:hypothetical protein
LHGGLSVACVYANAEGCRGLGESNDGWYETPGKQGGGDRHPQPWDLYEHPTWTSVEDLRKTGKIEERGLMLLQKIFFFFKKIKNKNKK